MNNTYVQLLFSGKLTPLSLVGLQNRLQSEKRQYNFSFLKYRLLLVLKGVEITQILIDRSRI